MTPLQQAQQTLEQVKADLKKSKQELHQREADLLAGQRRNAPPSELGDLAHLTHEAQSRFAANRDALPVAERKLQTTYERAWGLREIIVHEQGAVATLEREVARLTHALENRRANAASKIMAVEADLERLVGDVQIPEPPTISPEQQQYRASAEVSRREVEAAFAKPPRTSTQQNLDDLVSKLERLEQLVRAEGGGG